MSSAQSGHYNRRWWLVLDHIEADSADQDDTDDIAASELECALICAAAKVVSEARPDRLGSAVSVPLHLVERLEECVEDIENDGRLAFIYS